jgi:type IV secretion system protein TrbG
MRLLVLVVWMLLAGCATVPPVPPMVHVPDPPPVVVEPTALSPAPPSLPAEEWERLMSSEPGWPPENPLTAITQATRRATLAPTAQAFVRGVLQFPYRPGAIYRIDVAVTGTTHLSFPAGERILVYGGLRPTDWFVQRVDGEGLQEASHLLITPQERQRRGRLTIVTSKGVYYLDLRSHEEVGVTGVIWHHPEAAVRAPRGRAEIVHRGYTVTVESGAPAWVPAAEAIWDAGGKTYIQAPAIMAHLSAPVIYVRHGAARHLVNYRLRGTLFVIDRLAQAFELRLGNDAGAEVVVVSRGDEYQALRCPGPPECAEILARMAAPQ